MTTILIMPVYNEEGIEDYINRIRACADGVELQIWVVDDYSESQTKEILMNLVKAKLLDKLIENQINMGHGPSVLAGLEQASKSDVELVVTVDGDGQISPIELIRFIEHCYANDYEMVEGIRRRENEPFFRKVVSYTTRLIVFIKSGEFPKDANTPLRGYKTEYLRDLLKSLGTGLLVPNLHVSIQARRKNGLVGTLMVESKIRKGKNSVGVTWKTRRKSIPSKRFVLFCLNAMREISKL